MISLSVLFSKKEQNKKKVSTVSIYKQIHKLTIKTIITNTKLYWYVMNVSLHTINIVVKDTGARRYFCSAHVNLEIRHNAFINMVQRYSSNIYLYYIYIYIYTHIHIHTYIHLTHIHITHTHTHIYIYIYMCVRLIKIKMENTKIKTNLKYS